MSLCLTYNPSTSNCAQRRKLGGWAQAGYDPLQDHLTDTVGYEYTILNGWLVEGLGKRAECVGMEWNNVIVQDGFTAIEDQYGVSAFESSQYFYHPDHLGSSSFITDANGDVNQHLQYLPFGEPWIDQRTSNNIRFTFSGKERDDETGYNYFGARYYNADISIWLSVDPMASERAWLSPYNYCSNNPIIRTDPSGMLDDWYQNENFEIVWFDRTDQNFTDASGSNWKNVGANLDDVKKFLNIPDNQRIRETNFEWITIGGGPGGKGILAPVAVDLNAFVSFELATNQNFSRNLVDGETKVTGLLMNVSLIASTLNTINFESMGGSFSFDKEWTPTGLHSRIHGSPFSKVDKDVIGNFNTYCYGSSKADLRVNHFQRNGGNSTIYINPAIKYNNSPDGFKTGILTPSIEKEIR